ncbi:hypothetical protein [Solirubrum puertoriconensis]|uniref:Lipoprotein n=1 Tax=Solirubrum puertoriconensis TaxID=1751427 RepID=A0A9X0HMF0_SOLP1|nr:hypothetical protein [Solirubrum puertoriconensis]KUG08646.1 hypothetical protein ASU33_10900 [Solirubrum puertoriconensis]
MFTTRFSRLFTAAALGVALLSACETSRQNFPEGKGPNRKVEESLRVLDSPNRLVAVVEAGKVEYKVPRQQLMVNFTRQFADGTVVNNAQVRKVQSSAKEKPSYFLVGMGLRNGMFRAMAMPLELTTDNELYLSSATERYLLEGRGCQMCYFNFNRSAITGSTCEDNSGGGTCDLEIMEKNSFFATSSNSSR